MGPCLVHIFLLALVVTSVGVTCNSEKNDEVPHHLTWRQKVQSGAYNALCAVFGKLPLFLSKLLFKSTFFQRKLEKLGVPLKCADLYLIITYPFPRFRKMKKLRNSKIPMMWIMGGPGSGKGSLSEEMSHTRPDGSGGFTHISLGEMLRATIDKEATSFNSKVIKSITSKGDLIPDSVSLAFLAKEIMSSLDNSKGFLIDGFPRSLGQALSFQEKIKPPDAIIFLELSDESMRERVLKRNRGRPDDNEETLKERLKVFHHEQPLITSNSMFQSKVITINVEGTREENKQKFIAAVKRVANSKASS